MDPAVILSQKTVGNNGCPCKLHFAGLYQRKAGHSLLFDISTGIGIEIQRSFSIMSDPDAGGDRAMPQSMVIINPDTPGEITASLRRHGLDPLMIPRCDALSPPLSGHPDLQVFFHESRAFCRAGMPGYFPEALSSRCHITVCGAGPEREYPADVPFNAACTGSMAFHRSDRTAPEIRSFLAEKDIPLIHVRQGYSRCSTVIVDEGRVITADRGIHEAALAQGAKSLLVRPGFVELPGYRHGFIGGASGSTSDRVFFTGDLSRHPDHEAIRHFIAGSGKKILCLTDGPLLDLGSLLFI
jgi:hypothetical protein